MPAHPPASTATRSLKATLALPCVGLLVLAIGTLALYGDFRLRQDMGAQVQAQQQATATLLAQGLEQLMLERTQALEATAQTLALRYPEPEQTPALQQHLHGLSALQKLFTGGFYVTDRSGGAIASYPPHFGPERRSTYAQSSFVQAALTGHTSFSAPMPGLVPGTPILTIATPLPSADGQPLGTLVGVLRLHETGLLSSLPKLHGLSVSHFMVVDRPSRTIVMASEPNLILQTLPAPGSDTTLERLLDGQRNSATLQHDGRT